MQSSLAEEPVARQGRSRRFKAEDFLLLCLEGDYILTSLAILPSRLASGLRFDQQKAKLPLGFRPVTAEEIMAFVGAYRKKHHRYPDVEHIPIWTLNVSGENRMAVIIDSAAGKIAQSPQQRNSAATYTGAPIVIAATRE